MSEKKEDIHKTSVKGVGEPNPPRKQGETEEGKPIEEPAEVKPVTPPKAEHKEEEHKHRGK